MPPKGDAGAGAAAASGHGCVLPAQAHFITVCDSVLATSHAPSSRIPSGPCR